MSDWALCDARTVLVRRLPAGVALGEAVVVLGLGLIGQLAAQLSRLTGRADDVLGVLIEWDGA